MPIPATKIVLVVEMFDDGTECKVSLNGPLENEILCLGILEKAKYGIVEYNKMRAEQRTKGTLPPVNFPSGGGINPNSTWRPPSS